MRWIRFDLSGLRGSDRRSGNTLHRICTGSIVAEIPENPLGQVFPLLTVLRAMTSALTTFFSGKQFKEGRVSAEYVAVLVPRETLRLKCLSCPSHPSNQFRSRGSVLALFVCKLLLVNRQLQNFVLKLVCARIFLHARLAALSAFLV